GQLAVEGQLAAKVAPVIDPPEQEVGIGDRGLPTAAIVASGAGIRAGAVGADVETALGVDAGNASAAGADLLDVQRRDPQGEPARVAADEVVARAARQASLDHAGFR